MKIFTQLTGIFLIPLSTYAQNTLPSSGNVGVGTNTPLTTLDVRGNLLLDNGGDPIIYTNSVIGDTYRYLQLINSTTSGNATGLKAGGILVSDAYNYANPSRNDMVIKGKLAIGIPTNYGSLDVKGLVFLEASNAGRFMLINHPISGNSGVFEATASNDIHLKAYSDAFSTPQLFLKSGGNVLIGKTAQTNSNYKLDVAGKIRSNEVVVNTNGADFVFSDDYQLPSLEQVKAFIKANGHLPDISPAKTMQEEGVGIGDLQIKLLQKIEEMTLYILKQQEELDALKKLIKNKS